MAQKIPERLVWAVEMLEVNPADRILEIGCGHGVAAALIAERLADGQIIALDRSEKMITAASCRNAAHITAGKAIFKTASLAGADLGDQQFNKIFAVNVNVFWQKPDKELAMIRKHLTPGGTLYLFYQPPDIRQAKPLADKVTRLLAAQDFTIKAVILNAIADSLGVCIMAQ